MKKIIITLLICAMPSLAFAVDAPGTYTSTAGATITGQIDSSSTALRIHTLSNNVVANIIWSTTQYLMWTHHNNGTKYYGAVTDRTKLYWIERAVADFTAPTTSASDTFETAGWASF
jgi:hypothetical protein